MHFFEKYFSELTADRADSLLLWTLSTFFVWFWLVRLRKQSIEGMAKEGDNPSWETREQIIWFTLLAFYPAAFYILYLTQFKLWGFGAFALIIGYQIFGRFIFDWILAFKGGLSEVPEHEKETKVKVETKVETSQQ